MFATPSCYTNIERIYSYLGHKHKSLNMYTPRKQTEEQFLHLHWVDVYNSNKRHLYLKNLASGKHC